MIRPFPQHFKFKGSLPAAGALPGLTPLHRVWSDTPAATCYGLRETPRSACPANPTPRVHAPALVTSSASLCLTPRRIGLPRSRDFIDDQNKRRRKPRSRVLVCFWSGGPRSRILPDRRASAAFVSVSTYVRIMVSCGLWARLVECNPSRSSEFIYHVPRQHRKRRIAAGQC